MKKWYVTCEYSDGEYWHEFDAEVEAPTLMLAIVVAAVTTVAELSNEEVVAFRGFMVEEKEENNAR